MISNYRVTVYLLFLLSLAIWVGSGFYYSLSTNISWFQDPITYINHSLKYSLPGQINPWPISTAMVGISAIAAIILFINYKGNGRNFALYSIVGTLLIIVATFLYFVPTLIKIFGNTASLSEAQLTSISREWIILNLVRIVLVICLFMSGLIGLLKFNKQSN